MTVFKYHLQRGQQAKKCGNDHVVSIRETERHRKTKN